MFTFNLPAVLSPSVNISNNVLFSPKPFNLSENNTGHLKQDGRSQLFLSAQKARLERKNLTSNALVKKKLEEHKKKIRLVPSDPGD